MEERKPLLTSIKGKVIAASLLACVAVVMALVITYFSFNELLNTVDELTTPNRKLVVLNHLYRQVTQLDQLQRAAVISYPPRSYARLLQESKPLILTLDTLRLMRWEDEQQLERLDEIERMLHQRDRTLLRYLKLKSEFISNEKFADRFDSLASIISWSQVNVDSSVTTTERRTITTTHLPQEPPPDDRSFLNKLFGKKKESSPEETRIEVTEELRVRIDTLSTAQQDSAIAEIGRIMKNIQLEQELQSQEMLSRELALINTNRKLIRQILGTLQEVEGEERSIQQANNSEAVVLVNQSVLRIGIIIIIAFLLAAVLVFLILTDVTRSNLLRQQLIQAKNEAERLSQIKQRFLANMSHEIRTPLQSILGFAEQLKQTGQGQQESINAIYTSSEHLLHIVNEILDFSKIESGKLVLEREVFDLHQLIHEVEAAIRIQAHKKHLELIIEVESDHCPLLLGDPFRLRQVLYNLLGNAVKFTEKGSVTLHVALEDETYMMKCVFRIVDTGIGMEADEIDQVFQQFEQGKKSIHNPSGGTGLGLTIVKKLIDAQQGKLNVASEPGKGSVFTVELHFDKAPQHHKEDVADVLTRGEFNGTVMIVDDDATILNLCKLILDKHHINAVLFSNPDDALHYEITDDIKLVLLDIRMPDISGIDLCKAFRKKISRNTRIIALTAHVLPQERAALLDEGFDHLLTKPFREHELLNLLGVSSYPPKSANNGVMADLSSLTQMTMGDEALLRSVLLQFMEDTTTDLTALKRDLPDGQPHVREHIHRLAGRTGQLGAREVSGLLREIETKLANGIDASAIASEINDVIQKTEALLAHIREEHLGEKTT